MDTKQDVIMCPLVINHGYNLQVTWYKILTRQYSHTQAALIFFSVLCISACSQSRFQDMSLWKEGNKQ